MLPDFRVRQRDFLLEISRAITAQLDLSEVLKRVLNASIVMLAGQVGLVALREQDGYFYVRAVSGVDASQLGPTSTLIATLNERLHELFSGEEPTLWSEEVDEKLGLMAAEIDRKLRQSVALPLMFAGEPLGLMIVFRTFRGAATANDVQILQSFADQAAIAVHNAQLYENIDQERRRLAAILDHSGDGVMILTTDLQIQRINRALERMTAWNSTEAVGRHQDEVIVWKRLESTDLQKALDEGWPFSPTAGASSQTALFVEGDLQRRDGIVISIGITYAPLFTADNRLAGIIGNVRDITNWRKAQEMQNTFVSIISHELKTPVAIIKGYAATLRRTDVDWDLQVMQENLAVIEDEADRLTELIQNLLTASKLQTQRQMSLEMGEVWLDQLATTAVERYSPQTQTHEFRLNFAPDFPVVQGDEMRLRQVIDNLLSNAVKYSPDGGLIEVGGYFDEETVTVYVRDQGVGIPADDLQRVFDRFYRVDGKLSRKTQGTGLGLYLSKSIIEAHGGSIGVDSKPGAGATFYFVLPKNI
ncbi:MAG: ATP-binding protein [bacterium]|nr:ATP-binding protein [bacterium]